MLRPCWRRKREMERGKSTSTCLSHSLTINSHRTMRHPSISKAPVAVPLSMKRLSQRQGYCGPLQKICCACPAGQPLMNRWTGRLASLRVPAG
ncbi:hypothetical protein B0T18DRAFT_133415 [Schizothecium vesticola]|uniref:Uncharacterized protein n=1 Tax=Schizothecium vesticola TaxID=314040 RepID=A0AA40K4Q3_9PEZI|nr:hypothetical protein B0T18DRAFT_133415 [Schizothecium vesticola]